MKRTNLLIATIAALLVGACAKPRESAVAPADTPFAIVATDSGYIAPDTLHAGLNHFTYENRGSQIHECMFIRLPDGMSTADYIAAVGAGAEFPKGAVDCSGPGLTSPQQKAEMWLPLEPGRYMLGCWYKDHITEIPTHEIIVHGDPAVPVSPPHEDVTLRLIDFRFELVGEIEHGVQTIRVETVGPSMHEADIYRLDGGQTIETLRAWQAAGKQGPLAATILGGVLDSHDLKRVVWLRHDFTTGRYVLWCEMPMVQTGDAPAPGSPHVTHAQAGMFKEFEID